MGTDRDVFVHLHALCESDEVGHGTRVWAFAHVMDGARIGRDCNVCDHVFVESGVVIGNRVTLKNGVMLFDGVTIEDDVFVGPNVTFTNDLTPRSAVKKPRAEFVSTTIREGVTIGAGAVVVCGTTIEQQAFVGAGSVVVHDVPRHALVVGNPARQVGWACRCGARVGPDLTCACGRAYREATNGIEDLVEERST